MAGVQIANLHGTVSLDARNYFSTLGKLHAQTNSTFTSIARTVRTVVAGFIAVQAARGLKSVVKGSLESIKALDKLQLATGATVPDLQAYMEASEVAGDTQLNLAKAIRSVQTAQDSVFRGSKQGARDFQRLPERIDLAFAHVRLGFAQLGASMPPGLSKMLSLGQEIDFASEIAVEEANIKHLQGMINFIQDFGESLDSEFNDKVEEAMRNAGTIVGRTTDTISPAMERLIEDLDRVKSSISDGLTDTLADFFTTGKNGFRELGQAIIKDFLGALLRASVVTPLLNAIGLGAGGGFFSGLTGRAGGGDVDAGRAYIVGENGPELMVPRASSKIIPTNATNASGGGSGSTYYIDARGADTTAVARLEGLIQSLNGSIEPRALAAVMDARRRNRMA